MFHSFASKQPETQGPRLLIQLCLDHFFSSFVLISTNFSQRSRSLTEAFHAGAGRRRREKPVGGGPTVNCSNYMSVHCGKDILEAGA